MEHQAINNESWVCTDPSCNQYRRDISKNVFEFKEDRSSLIDPETKKEFRAVIDLSEYTEGEMWDAVQAFGYPREEMEIWIKEGKNLDLIAECIFELE